MNEAALLWFVNDQALDETLGYKTATSISTSSFPQLSVRAALNDNALFRVGIQWDNLASCIFPAPLTWAAAEANGGYLVKSVNLAPGHQIKAICIELTDNPDATAMGRSNVLIDYIYSRSATGTMGWYERFTGAP